MEERMPLEMERLLIEAMRRMSPAEKFRRMCAITESLNEMTLALLRQQYPHATEREYRLRLAARRGVPPEMLKKAFGWDVEKEGY